MVVILPPPPNQVGYPSCCTHFQRCSPSSHLRTNQARRYSALVSQQWSTSAIRSPSSTCHEPDRAVYYGSHADSYDEVLASCFVEVYGDSGVVVLGNAHVAMPRLTRDLVLLDLRRTGAMRAGTVAAIAKCDHAQSQPWSRHFYESIEEYGTIDGLLYLNAHNDGPASMLYERASEALVCEEEFIARLDHPALWPLLVRIMNEHKVIT